MRVTLFLVIFTIWYLEFQAKEISDDVELSSILRNELASTKYHQKLSLADVWNNIKNTASHAWESIKNIAINIKKKLAVWIQETKIKVQELKNAFEERLNKIKNRVNEMIEDIKVTGIILKKCLQDRKQEIDKIIKNILLDVTNCISNNLNYLSRLETRQYEPVPNKTDFFNKIQNKLNLCLEKNDSSDAGETCIHYVRNGIFEDLENTEEVILKNHIEATSLSDDLLGTIIGCTTNGIIRASSDIANETVHIIECVTQG